MKRLLAEHLRNILTIFEQGDPLDTVLVYKDKQGKERKVTARSVQKQGSQHPAWPQLQQLLGPRIPKAKEQPTKKTTKAAPTDVSVPSVKVPRAPKAVRVKVDKVKSTEKDIEELIGETTLDVKSLITAIRGVDSSEGGDRGAGTASSAAGEAATVLLLQRMQNLRSSEYSTVPLDEFLKNTNDEMLDFLSKLRGIPGSVLDEGWARAARKQVFSILHTMENNYSVGIDEIAWDNSTGRDQLGLGPKPASDRSDLYIKAEDGRIIGVSLKKDGNVFLANQGLKKVLEEVSVNAPDDTTRKKITGIADQHFKTVSAEFNQLIQSAEKNKLEVIKSLKNFNRLDSRDLSASKYDIFFTPNGKLTKDAMEMLTSGGVSLTTTAKGEPKKLSGNEQKLLLRTMPFVDNPAIIKHLENMRGADKQSTQSLLKLIDSDPSVNSTVTNYLIDALDLVQLVTERRPFGDDYPVDEFFISYGEANLTPDGEGMPLSVTRDTVLKTLNLPENLSDEQLRKVLQEKFIVDTEDDGKIGFLRLRVVNQSPPPNYFYPSIATLGVRSRGLKAAPLMELAQHSGWTYTLLNNNPNPQEWPEHQKIGHAQDTLKFLARKIKDPTTTRSERMELSKDFEFYLKIMRGED